MERDQFISVFKENQNLIYKICWSYCPDPENRKDLQQEIFLQLWNSFSKFDGRVKLTTWIYRIALNTAITFYRNNSRHNGKKTIIDDSIISLSNVDYIPELDENIAALYRFIGNLKEMDKAVILLYLDDNSYKDTAEILGITETNVATKINRIKKILREKFSNG